MALLIYDTETTGKLAPDGTPADSPLQPRMCAIAAVLLTGPDLVESARMYSLVKPDGWTIPAETTAIHGLTDQMCHDNGRPVADVLEQWWTSFYTPASVLTAYGIYFDNKIMRGELRRAGRKDFFKEKPEFCTMFFATKACKLAPTAAMQATGRHFNKTAKLTEACEILLGYKHEGAHNAMDDVIVTAELVRYLRAHGLVSIPGHETATGSPPALPPKGAPASVDNDFPV